MSAWFGATDNEVTRCAFQFKIAQLWLGQRNRDFIPFDEENFVTGLHDDMYADHHSNIYHPLGASH